MSSHASEDAAYHGKTAAARQGLQVMDAGLC